MKTPDAVIQKIIQLDSQGHSSREIANLLGIGKTTANDYARSNRVKSSDGPRVLLWDLENTPSLGAVFGRFNQNVSHSSIIREGGVIISSAHKFIGNKEVSSFVLNPEEAKEDNDREICSKLLDVFEQTDIVIGHNILGHDLPLFKARLALNKLPMHKKVRVIDTYQLSKKLKFNSKKLDSLCDYFKIGRKISHSGIDLWIRCMNGDPEALKEMQTYNERDVELLEELWYNLRPYETRALNLGQYYNDGNKRCPSCASTDVVSTGNLVYTEVSAFEEYKCNACGYRSRGREQKNSKEKRSNLLM